MKIFKNKKLGDTNESKNTNSFNDNYDYFRNNL